MKVSIKIYLRQKIKQKYHKTQPVGRPEIPFYAKWLVVIRDVPPDAIPLA